MNRSNRTELILALRMRRHNRHSRPVHQPSGYRYLGLGGVLVLMMALCSFATPVFAAMGVLWPLRAELQQGMDQLNNLQVNDSFQTTRIYDRNKLLLAEIFGDGRRTLIPLSRMPQSVLDATIATEDQSFRTNFGVDLAGILRATLQNTRSGGIVSGASTITQQVVRNTIFTYKERTERSYQRKLKEILLSLVMTQTYSKDQILEAYLNEIYYGELAYGIEAAAQVYFSKRAVDLTLPEATLLAGLPQSPVEYDPFTDESAAKARQRDVLSLMVEQGYLTASQADQIYAAPLHFVHAKNDRLAPHFVDYVRDLLEQQYGPDKVANGGLIVTTSLDMRFQRIAEKAAAEQVAKLRQAQNVKSAAVVALKPSTGEILAMVGSVDYNDRSIDGQVNVAIRERQPGSSIKPINYATAMEDGLSPGTLVMDTPITLPQDDGKEYKPVNYDERFHGLLTLRQALANSYNIPALRVVQYNGIKRLLDKAHAMGITGLNRSLEWYGPAITLGGGEVKLLDLTNAYATLDNLGGYIPSQAILRVNDSRGNVLFDYQAPAPKPALDPRAAFMVTSILTDTKAREPAFGVHNPLVLSRPAAAKTGTTNDFRDNWTLGYTPGLVVGVWVGNPDNAEMKHSTGITGAAPIWHDVMEAAYADHSLEDTLQIQGHSPPDQFAPPPGLVKARVCQPTPGGSCQVNEDWVYAEQAKALGDSSVNYQLGKVSLVELSSSTGNNQSSGYCRTSSHLKVPADQVITLDVAKVVSRRSGSVSLWDGNDRLPRIYKFLVGENEDLRVRVRVGRRIEDRAMYTFYPYNDSVNVRNLPECTPELLAGAVVPTPIVAATDTAIDGTVDESTPEPIITLEPEPTIQPTATPPPPPPPPIEQATGGIITFPGPGQVLHGGAAVQGRVQFSAAEYKFYKLEIAPAGSNNFVTLGDVHPNPVTGQLEWLAANALPPGDYILRLVLVRQDGNWIVTSQVQFTIAR